MINFHPEFSSMENKSNSPTASELTNSLFIKQVLPHVLNGNF